MKSKLVIALIYISTVLAARPKSCAGKNIVTDRLAKVGVKILDFVTPSERVCKNEWEAHGTCCDATSMKNYLSQQKTETRSAAKNMGESLEKTVDLISKSMSPKVLVTADAKKSVMKHGSVYLPSVYLEIKKDVDYFKAHLNQFYDSQEKCADAINEERTSAICYSCSGRGEIFFQNDEARMLDSECTDFLRKCQLALFDLSRYQKMLDNYKTIFVHMQQTVTDFNPDVDPKDFEFGIAWFKNPDVVSAHQKCSNLNSPFCKSENRATICRAAQVIVRAPAVVLMKAIALKGTTGLKTVSVLDSPSNSNLRANQMLMSQSIHRLLQQGNGGNDKPELFFVHNGQTAMNPSIDA